MVRSERSNRSKSSRFDWRLSIRNMAQYAKKDDTNELHEQVDDSGIRYHPLKRWYTAVCSTLTEDEHKKNNGGERHQASLLWTY
mmetsp:Transcript_10598/g.15341  ORF Transcript_10598/g.15341 Transcript_10598/m.15341 type:complete len:84 (+) Transcript_10598:29-280(+)